MVGTCDGVYRTCSELYGESGKKNGRTCLFLSKASMKNHSGHEQCFALYFTFVAISDTEYLFDLHYLF